MLTDLEKTSTLWKHYKGFGSTHVSRETFEELYRSFKEISANSVLTYGDLIPRNENDRFFEEVSSLDDTNPILEYEESSFKKVNLIQKYTDFQLTRISPNCDHSFVIAINGEQIKNIIPFDFSDTGLYNYTLKTQDNVEIPFGTFDWIVDTNSSLLTFNNGIPEGVSAAKPPKLTFFQYIGPVGERHYIDAVQLDLSGIKFSKGNPATKLTDEVKKLLDDIEAGFFDSYKFGGNDTTQGIGLQFNIISNVYDSSTKDPLKGFDDNSNSQVVHLLSHYTGKSPEGLRVLFASENLTEESYKITVTNDFEGETGAPVGNISKIDVEGGFFIVQGSKGTYNINVEKSDDLYAALLVRDNKTLDYELYYPRDEKEVTLKIPVFVDLMKLPPHLKLTTGASFTDHITPQYYGPRVADFVIASDKTSVNYRSADYVVYNKEGSYLSDAIENRSGPHIFLRNGIYENGGNVLNLPSSTYFHGESRRKVVVKNTEVLLEEDSAIECITFIDCKVIIKNIIAIKMCDFINTKVYVENGQLPATIIASSFEDLEVDGNEMIEGSQILRLKITGSATLFGTSVAETLESSGKVEIYNSFAKVFHHTSGEFFIHSSRIGTLNCTNSEKTSILNTTAIDYVENLPEFIKIDTSYITKFSKKIKRRVYPDKATIPYYSSFERRVYAKLPDPFLYDEETNKLNLKLDTIEHTIFINKNGELQCRFFNAGEIELTDPDAIKTQIESVYGEHADTVLDKEKPRTVDEAIIDLFWSKADLKNGKVPIDQLPDSVAYGGLNLVGMWQFEDSNGEYPTFEDTIYGRKYSSDDEYTGLQNGWFFIVSASHKEDDPVFPQKSNDGVEWTAGDWIIYTGGNSRVIDFTKPVKFFKGDFTITSEGGDIFEVTSQKYKKPVYTSKNQDSNDDSDDSDDSYEDEIDVPKNLGTIKINDEKIITEINGDLIEKLLNIELGQKITDVFKVAKASYNVSSTLENPWEKLDRAYLDPVYSRLPQYATVAGGENPEWSIEDNGTGLLRLSFVSLAEAIRMINESLLKLSPDRSTSIRFIKPVLDEESTTAEKTTYIEVANGELSDYLENLVKEAWNSESGKVFFKQSGITEYNLPLEKCFYSGKKSNISVKDGSEDITENCDIEKFDPYEKYRLGFRTPTEVDSSEIKGFVELGRYGYQKNHKVKFTQYDLEPTKQFEAEKEALEGESQVFDFLERKFYKMEDCNVKVCLDRNVNIEALNTLMRRNRTGGMGFIPKGTIVTGVFRIENFTKYGTVSPDASVTLISTFAEKSLEIEIDSLILEMTEESEEVYDLLVQFHTMLETDSHVEIGDLIVTGFATNFGIESRRRNVLTLKDLMVIDPNEIPEIVESGKIRNPKLGEGTISNFGGTYEPKLRPQEYPELIWQNNNNNPGFGWPEKEKYLDSFTTLNEREYVINDKTGVYEEAGRKYRYITFKKELPEIYDLCGFFIDLEWVSEAPTLMKDDGTFEKVLLQICVDSNEEHHITLLDANTSIRSPFFEASFKEDEPCGYPGKSTAYRRRVSFGRRPVAIKDIYVRVGIPSDSGIILRKVNIDVSEE